MRLLGLDVGSKTVGVAISDELRSWRLSRLMKADITLVCVH